MTAGSLTNEQRAALARHGYDPDIPPCGQSGPPSRFESLGSGWLRPHVCQLDGIEIDGHELSDLFPEDGICLHCHRDVAEFDTGA